MFGVKIRDLKITFSEFRYQNDKTDKLRTHRSLVKFYYCSKKFEQPGVYVRACTRWHPCARPVSERRRPAVHLLCCFCFCFTAVLVLSSLFVPAANAKNALVRRRSMHAGPSCFHFRTCISDVVRVCRAFACRCSLGWRLFVADA